MSALSDTRTMDMTEGPIFRKVLLFSLPIMLSNVLQLVFNAADTIVVGRYSGALALAAVGSVGSLNNLIISLFVGLSIGVNVLVAQYTGAHDDENVSETVHTAVVVSVIGGVFLAVAGFLLASPLLTMMGSPEDVLPLAVLYTRILFIGMPVQMLYNFCAAILRAAGDTKRPLYFLTFAGIVNVFLNLFFVIVLKMSVAGVALATIISQTVSAWLIVRCLMRMRGPMQLFPSRLHVNGKLLLEIIRIGLPAGIQSSFFSFSNVIIQSTVNTFGAIVVAGNSAASNVGNFIWQAMNTFQVSVTCFAGQNIGARKPRRVARSLWACLTWVFIFGSVLGALVCVFVRPLLALYAPNDPAVVEAGIARIYIMCGPYFICGMMDVMTGVLRGIGYSTLPMIISLLGACAFRLGWIAFVFPHNPTMANLIFSYPVSWSVTLAVLSFFFAILWHKLLSSYTAEERAMR